MVTPQRAPVRPRVVVPTTGETVLLEDEVQSLLERGVRGLVALLGPAGAGKTTAMDHLAAALPAAASVTLLDEPDESACANLMNQGLVVYARREAFKVSHVIQYRVAPWRDDDLIEYLLAVHRDQCGRVMSRLQAAGDSRLADGSPELWRIVLDRMAADEAVCGAGDALQRFMDERLPDPSLRGIAQAYCLAALKQHHLRQVRFAKRLADTGCDPEFVRATRHRAIQIPLATERIAADLRHGKTCAHLARPFPLVLVRAVANSIAGDDAAVDHLKSLVTGRKLHLHAMAASILHACGVGWQPKPFGVSRRPTRLPHGIGPWLAGAYLAAAQWPEICLAHMDIGSADLSKSALAGAILECATAQQTDFRGATLCGASLRGLQGQHANFAGADLGRVRAADAFFNDADFNGATLDNASLCRCSFLKANLESATFRRADLSGAILEHATIRDADFTGANLSFAQLPHLKLAEARFAGAKFSGARMTQCDLEGMELPEANFAEADLSGAALTASCMPRANFRGAMLNNCGLADIDWEDADLRDADLQGATFHMGSTRGGLVGSPIASEGSRTGFYTDDYLEQDFKSPEEIRKANLCGADLRGAIILDVDFYLVDLRGAKYDEEQADHFRRCRAILEDRCY